MEQLFPTALDSAGFTAVPDGCSLLPWTQLGLPGTPDTLYGSEVGATGRAVFSYHYSLCDDKAQDSWLLGTGACSLSPFPSPQHLQEHSQVGALLFFCLAGSFC